MSKTAVDWLFEQLCETPKDKFSWYYLFEKAKAMEKDQIIDSFLDGYKSHPYLAEQYYKETYEKDA
jgi:hypothetical protein